MELKRKVIVDIENIDYELATLEEKKNELIQQKSDLIKNNPLDILKHDDRIIEQIYSLLNQMLGTYDSDEGLFELDSINSEIKCNLDNFYLSNLIFQWFRDIRYKYDGKNIDELKKETITSIKKELTNFEHDQTIENYDFLHFVYNTFTIDLTDNELIRKVKRDLEEFEENKKQLLSNSLVEVHDIEELEGV